jgi:peptidoglycan/LPS O-acetylase OafA/YrhL
MDIFVIIWLLCLFPFDIKWDGYFEQYLSKERTNVLKGISATVIMFLHIGNSTEGGILISAFALVGYVAVGIFFFISGYGLMKNYMMKGTAYLSNFLSKRLLPIIIPYAIVNFIYLLYQFVDEGLISVKGFLVSFINGDPMVRFSWYVIAILFFYIAFYISFKFVKTTKLSLLLFFTITVGYILGCRYVQYDVWWYNSCIVLLLGLLWACFEKEITLWYQRHYLLKTALLLSLFLVTFCMSYSKLIVFEESFILGQTLSTFAFTLLALMIYSKIELKNKVWAYLGTISFELYILHGLMLKLFKSRFIYLESNLIYCACVLISSILLATLLHYITSKLFGLLKTKDKILVKSN